MSERPAAEHVLPLCFGPDGKLRRELRERITEVRCRKGHLVAALLLTVHGELWAVRDVRLADGPQDYGEWPEPAWSGSWRDEIRPKVPGIITMDRPRGTCTCGHRWDGWSLDPDKVDRSRRTMRVDELSPDPPRR